MGFKALLIRLLILKGLIIVANGDLTISRQNVDIGIGTCHTFELVLSDSITQDLIVFLRSVYPNVAKTNEDSVIFSASNFTQRRNVSFCGENPGHSFIISTPELKTVKAAKAFLEVSVHNLQWLNYVSLATGWIYFFLWSVSFYPQAYSNYKRKSVVGLSFDYVAQNISGHFLYAVFNCGLYWIPLAQYQYLRRHPNGSIPVQLNDVGFSVHAALVESISFIQYFIYETGGQTISKISFLTLVMYGCTIISSIALVALHYMQLLDFLYVCSYIKLSTILIKYIPQAIMNYQRKSTVGWSIENIICDFVGGILSIVQMLLISYNYDDWISLFGDASKLSLGILTIFFDVLFLLQHYVFYRHSEKLEKNGKILV